jgi:thiol peroxidase
VAQCTFKGMSFRTFGEVPGVGAKAPPFELVASSLAVISLDSYPGKRKVINVFPSIDTTACANSVRRFNLEAAHFTDVAVLNVSLDLPFAHKRFCGAEGIERAEALSGFRSDFGEVYGVEIMDGPLRGLYSRAVLVLDANNMIIHAEHVAELAQEPNYEAALAVLRMTRPSVNVRD